MGGRRGDRKVAPHSLEHHRDPCRMREPGLYTDVGGDHVQFYVAARSGFNRRLDIARAASQPAPRCLALHQGEAVADNDVVR